MLMIRKEFCARHNSRNIFSVYTIDVVAQQSAMAVGKKIEVKKPLAG